MERLSKISDGDNLFSVIVPRVNALVDAVNELGNLHGDNITIAVDEALGWCIRVLDQPTPAAAPGDEGGAEAGVMTAGPSGGYGSATFQSITVAADGTWTATGTATTGLVPLLK